MKDWKKIFHTNRDQKKVGVVILISDKIVLNKSCEKRQGHCIIIKGSIQEEDIKILYMLFTRDPFQNKGHIQTESEGLEKDILYK